MAKRKREMLSTSSSIFDEISDKIRNSKKDMWINIPTSVALGGILKSLIQKLPDNLVVVGLEYEEYICIYTELGHSSNRTMKYINRADSDHFDSINILFLENPTSFSINSQNNRIVISVRPTNWDTTFVATRRIYFNENIDFDPKMLECGFEIVNWKWPQDLPLKEKDCSTTGTSA